MVDHMITTFPLLVFPLVHLTFFITTPLLSSRLQNCKGKETKMPFTTKAGLIAALTLSLSTCTSAYPLYTFNSGSSLFPRDDNSTSISELQSCLSNTGASDLSYSSSSDYSSLSSSYNPIFNYKPLVIAVPSSAQQVSGIVECVSAQNGQVKLSPRSGGHSYEAYSLGGQDGSLVLDLRQLNSTTIDKDAKTATVGAGVRLGDLATNIWNAGGFALPHGTCPMVGVAGHALGGGFGFTTRAWGYLMDRVTSMQIVDKDGKQQTVSPTQNTDLWWGLRGGGANNFGVVTEFTFALQDGPSQIFNYAYSYKTNQDCAKAVVGLQAMTLNTTEEGGLPSDFGGELLIAGEAGGDFDGNACQLSGQHINVDRGTHDALMQKFHDTAGISAAESSVKPFNAWIDALTDIMGTLSTAGKVGTDHEQFYAKSLVQPNVATYDYDSALALVEKLNGVAGLQGTGNSISFDFLGPLSYPSAKAEPSAFNAHNASFIYQFYSYGFPGNDNQQGQQDVWNAFDELVETAKSSKSDADWGAYVNYVDARQENWPQAYYGGGLDRLKSLKQQWDPETIFYFPQSLANA